MRINNFLLSLSAIAVLSTGAAHAATNLVTNGGFEQTSNGTNHQLSYNAPTTANDLLHRTTVTGWVSEYNNTPNDGGYNFVLDSSIATTNASAIALRNENSLYAASANGGNFLASDAFYYAGKMSQSISGLTVGAVYNLTFEYAVGQQRGFVGDNTGSSWQVGFGTDSVTTSPLTLPSGDFSGWKTASMSFTATSVSEALSFLAKGTAPGAPPFMLLDGVSLTAAVPEPSTWGMLLGGIGLMGFMARRRASQRA